MISQPLRLTESSARSHAVAASRIAIAVLLLTGFSPARAEFPYPPCAGCVDPNDYEDYMHTAVMLPPVRPNEVGQYDFRTSSLVDPSLPATPEELGGVAGMSIDTAWQLTTGRPDVTVAHLDSGIRYDADNVRKAALNQGELPLPEFSATYDKNGDGVFNIDDYAADSRVSDLDGNGILDPRDLILAFSDSVDDDANGYVDDICGWDTHEHDNDPFDDADYGHGTGQVKDSSGEVNNGGKAPGLTKVKLQFKKGFWRFQVKAGDVDATPPGDAVFARLRIGDVCLERTRTCEPNTSGEVLKCKKPKV